MTSRALWRVVTAFAISLAGFSLQAQAHSKAAGFFIAHAETQRFEAGRSYRIETLNLQRRDSLQYFPAATYILIISLDGGNRGTIVAHGGTYDSQLRSRVRFTPSATRNFKILVTSNYTGESFGTTTLGDASQCGRADLKITETQTGLSRTSPGISFCGESYWLFHHAGECFRTTRLGTRSRPLVYYIASRGISNIETGDQIRWDRSSSSESARICFDTAGDGVILSTAGSISTEGKGYVDLVTHSRVALPAGQQLDGSNPIGFFSVFRTRLRLDAGETHLIQTTNLRRRDSLQTTPADTVMYLIDGDSERVLARNDDGFPGSLTSQIALQVPESKQYDLVVRSRSAASVGSFDLVVDGTVVTRNAPFAGQPLHPYLKAGLIGAGEDCIHTRRENGDPFLIWFPDPDDYLDASGFVVMNNNGSSGLNAKVCFSDFRRHFPNGDVARGMLLLGSASSSTEGRTSFLVVGSDHF